jgi:hypothetical protein
MAIVGSPSNCPADTLDTLDSPASGSAVACLGRGGRVLDRGMCVARPDRGVVKRSAIRRVSCASPTAWAQVTALVVYSPSCPDGSDRYLEAVGAYRPVTCLRLLSK